MHYPTDRITHTTAFVTLVVEQSLKRIEPVSEASSPEITTKIPAHKIVHVYIVSVVSISVCLS